MARLLAAVESAVSTDFALLMAAQGAVTEGPASGTYAGSAPGGVAMTCGTRYANAHVRLEHWDARPPAAADEWEDRDELPWSTGHADGPVQVSGFDPPGDEGLSLEGLAVGRVEVLARGRHRYRYGSFGADGLPPERWLLRFWPDPGGLDPLSGPPRRIAGPGPMWVPRSGWQLALHSWAQTGWMSTLWSLEGFREITLALMRVGTPCHPDDLLPNFGPYGENRERHGQYTWSSPVLGHHHRPVPAELDHATPDLRRLADAAGMDSVETFGDALTCLERLGLLARSGFPVPGSLVPNPAPRQAWEVPPLDQEPTRSALRLQALGADHRDVADDVAGLARWSADRTLTATPRRLAVRLSLPVESVLGGLALLAEQGASLVPGPTAAEADTLVELRVS